jgi:hypothetical protein
MMKKFTDHFKATALALAGAMAIVASPALAQELEAIDPDVAYDSSADAAIDGDLAGEQAAESLQQPIATDQTGNETIAFGSAAPQQQQATSEELPAAEVAQAETSSATADANSAEVAAARQGSETTYGQDDLIGAAEGVFGKGAEGLAGMIEGLLRDQGEPNGYITGREGGGAIGIGVRYGSGTLHHKVEGNRPVYWTGPSIGFDAGANAGKTFVLVYNLYDTEDLYKRFPAGEGQAYFVGGMHASYMRRGDIVLIPIRVGAGLRLGVNAGYMKFSKKQRWLPF